MDQSGCMPAAFTAMPVIAIALINPVLVLAAVVAFAGYGALRASRDVEFRACYIQVISR